MMGALAADSGCSMLCCVPQDKVQMSFDPRCGALNFPYRSIDGCPSSGLGPPAHPPEAVLDMDQRILAQVLDGIDLQRAGLQGLCDSAPEIFLVPGGNDCGSCRLYSGYGPQKLYRFQYPCRFRRGQKCPLHSFWRATWTRRFASNQGSSSKAERSHCSTGSSTVDNSSLKSPPFRYRTPFAMPWRCS